LLAEPLTIEGEASGAKDCDRFSRRLASLNTDFRLSMKAAPLRGDSQSS